MKLFASSRLQEEQLEITEALKRNYQDWFYDIQTVFGFTEDLCSLYGGRANAFRNLTYAEINLLNDMGIGFDITLTNFFMSLEGYLEAGKILDKLHREGNGVVCTSDILAFRLREDYPKFTIRASSIKQCDTLEKIDDTLRLYDCVTLPVRVSDDSSFLQSIPDKDKMIVFANAACAYYCRTFGCYRSLSWNYFDGSSTHYDPENCRRNRGKYQEFDLSDSMYEGFNSFKAIPRR